MKVIKVIDKFIEILPIAGGAGGGLSALIVPLTISPNWGVIITGSILAVSGALLGWVTKELCEFIKRKIKNRVRKG